MNIHTARKTSRREFIKLSAGALIALGVAPGCARFADSGHGDSFSFVVINDAHFSTPECPGFYERVRASVLSQPNRPELCLMAGDFSDNGSEEELGAMRDIFKTFGMPWRGVIGNHDYAVADSSRAAWDKIMPRSLNYHFEHRGWQIVALDSTEGKKADKTKIQPHTLAWVKENAPKLDRKKPTIIFTHFPLGPKAPKRPTNTDEMLTPFLDCNLVQVFGGHHHGFTRQELNQTVFVTNRCCSISKPNHDKTKEKGYFLCSANEGKVTWQFVEVPVA